KWCVNCGVDRIRAFMLIVRVVDGRHHQHGTVVVRDAMALSGCTALRMDARELVSKRGEPRLAGRGDGDCSNWRNADRTGPRDRLSRERNAYSPSCRDTRVMAPLSSAVRPAGCVPVRGA